MKVVKNKKEKGMMKANILKLEHPWLVDKSVVEVNLIISEELYLLSRKF